MAKINWKNISLFSLYTFFILIAGKISASYEGCVLMETSNTLRILFSLILLIAAFIFILFMKNDIYKMFLLSGVEK